MASLDSPRPDSPPNIPSLAIRTQDATNKFSRSISHKEASFAETPPRLSSTSLSPRLYLSQPSSPRLSFTSSKQDHDLHTIYRCISSVLKKDGQILSIAASNGLVYTGSQGSIIRIWKLPEFAECGQLKSKANMVVSLQVSNDKVYAAYADCKIRVWHRTWEGAVKHVRVATIPKPGGYVRSYITGKDKMMKHAAPITSLAINVSDDILYSASLDRTVKVWRISDLKCMETIQAHREPINAIVVADDGVLYTASDDATVRVWRRNFCSGDRPHSLTVTLPAKYSPVKTLTLTADGGFLYGGCTDGYIHYWLKGWFSGQLQYGGPLQGHTHAVMCLATAASYVVSGSADSSCRVWVRDPEGQHKCLAVLLGHRGPIRCVAAFVAACGTGNEEVDDGCTICTGSLDGVLKVWRVKCASSTARGTLQNNCEYFELA
ncbi:protein JINGUBANG-like [Coffea eugenioides]|uniref:protein JINGUBANG-like n=1 Tax=Coffea eugenioides TaxID=49369 RepID=UPI000F6099FA|nr:protein JINGUBANG-like [Coffea eugenioides]